MSASLAAIFYKVKQQIKMKLMGKSRNMNPNKVESKFRVTPKEHSSPEISTCWRQKPRGCLFCECLSSSFLLNIFIEAVENHYLKKILKCTQGIFQVSWKKRERNAHVRDT